jgi:hypothetical protein
LDGGVGEVGIPRAQGYVVGAVRGASPVVFASLAMGSTIWGAAYGVVNGVKAFAWLMPGKVRVFDDDDVDKAKLLPPPRE